MDVRRKGAAWIMEGWFVQQPCVTHWLTSKSQSVSRACSILKDKRKLERNEVDEAISLRAFQCRIHKVSDQKRNVVMGGKSVVCGERAQEKSKAESETERTKRLSINQIDTEALGPSIGVKEE